MISTITHNASQWRHWQAHSRSRSRSTSSLREDEGPLPSTSPVGTSCEPILIPSDVDSDVEDSGDDGQDSDDSRSDASLPPAHSLVISVTRSQPHSMSHADSLVRRVDDHDGVHSVESTLLDGNPLDGNGPCVTDVVIGSPRSAPHSAIGSSTPAHDLPGPCLAHLDQYEVHCQGDDMPTRGTPTCHDTVSETSHECPEPLSPDSSGQDLGTVDATKPGAAASDAIRAATPIFSPQSAPDSSTPAYTSQPLILAPLEAVEAPGHSGDVPLGGVPSRCSSISGTHDASSESQLSPETPQGQGLATTSCGSSDDEAQAYEAASGLSSGTQEARPPSPGPITRRRSRHKAAHRLAHGDDGESNADSDSQGSEDDLDHANLPRDEEYCPSLTADEERDQEGELSDEDEKCPRKRRKVSRSPMSHAAASVERPRRGRASLRSTAQLTKGGKRSRASGIPSPASSQATSTETEFGAVLARFEEWPLEDVSLKRITENGKTTFQLQFDWTPGTKHGHASRADRGWVDSRSTRTIGKAKRTSALRTHYTAEEDDLLRKLKEREGLAWPEIHRRFNETCPGRSVQSLQVHYSTKLKSRS